jgi:hypothetical protein
MLFIKKLLSTAGLLDEKSIYLSIACISTSRPIYLIFGQKFKHPIYVIRKINDPHALYFNNIHKRLYQLVGNLVPEPVGIYKYDGEQYDVQRGVKGAPWFQIKSRFHTKEARTGLEQRMWQTLRTFQTGICAESVKITNNLQPHEEMRKAYSEYQDTGEIVSSKLKSLVELAISELSISPDCQSISQHGDFCLNNLIIEKNHITVIDFEDFSITEMPMYDHFTLALSLPSCGTDLDSAAKVLSQPNIIAAAHSLGIPENIVPWHFLHHILLRLGPWSIGEKRAAYRVWLKQVLEGFVEAQTNR